MDTSPTTSASVIIRLCDKRGNCGFALHCLLDRFRDYELIILDTSPSDQRKARHVRMASDFNVNFVYTGLKDAIKAATCDYIAVLDFDELPEDLTKVCAVRREYIDLEEEE